jgi:hypothetical protein
MTLLVSGLYDIDDRLAEECGADGGMIIGIYNRIDSRFVYHKYRITTTEFEPDCRARNG